MGGFDLGPVSLGPTPIAMLISVLLVGIVLLVVLLIASQAGGKLVDKRWPANEPLTPSEVLWGESGGYVKKTFPGLDPVIGRDLTQYITTKKVPAGTALVEAGDLPTQFIMLKSGAAAVDGGATLKPGDSIGGDNIITRTPHQAAVRTTAASEIASLEAEDYLAAMALGMSDDDDDYVVHVLGGYFEEPTAAPATAAAATTTMVADPPRVAPAPPAPATMAPPTPTAAPPPAPAPAPMAPPAAPGWGTHRVNVAELPAYSLPAGAQVTRTLAGGTAVEQLEALPGWAHVRTADGWQGWVPDHGLVHQ